MRNKRKYTKCIRMPAYIGRRRGGPAGERMALEKIFAYRPAEGGPAGEGMAL